MLENTLDEAKRLFMATRVLSFRVFFFTLYSLGLRLGEGLRLQVGDIDAGVISHLLSACACPQFEKQQRPFCPATGCHTKSTASLLAGSS
uniref:Phage integrase family protein n=2 Tax=Candidatus Kentrum sp. MB TaxID=2138164 RepID=A0A451BFN3_9GAMM|nr:MAG: hypothetical protein BECKMB1821I_GA0114274_109311 [Candidatus Kentron sp. MB]VFK77072.1 MAG: hypothetical protein BECKMB1821H_GA0114242_109611 [Candidatus Kentron sp. MB]